MPRTRFEQLVDAAADASAVWELMHENSKTTPYDVPKTTAQVLARMQEMWTSLPYEGYPVVTLPRELGSMTMSLRDAIVGRETARNLSPAALSLETIATLLFCAYGVTRSNEGTGFPRPFRTVPSGGALYPLEIYFHSARVNEIRAGLYHYDASAHSLRVLNEYDGTRELSDAIVQRNIAVESSAIFFITALFERSVFKYGDHGYRFALLEAGHVAQNMNLAATALGLRAINLGGYFDRRIDRFLSLDGLNHSTIYCVAVGGNAEGGAGAAE